MHGEQPHHVLLHLKPQVVRADGTEESAANGFCPISLCVACD